MLAQRTSQGQQGGGSYRPDRPGGNGAFALRRDSAAGRRSSLRVLSASSQQRGSVYSFCASCAN